MTCFVVEKTPADQGGMNTSYKKLFVQFPTCP